MGTLEDGNQLEALDTVIEPTFEGEADAKLIRFDGGFADNNWQENPNGQDYTQRLSEAGRSDLLDWARDQLQPRVQRVFEEFSERYDWGDPGEIRFSLSGRSESTGDRGRRDPGRGPAPLEGAPQGASRDGKGPDAELVSVAERYAQARGIDLRRQAEHVDVHLWLSRHGRRILCQFTWPLISQHSRLLFFSPSH